jgi:hypothetical protein
VAAVHEKTSTPPLSSTELVASASLMQSLIPDNVIVRDVI